MDEEYDEEYDEESGGGSRILIILLVLILILLGVVGYLGYIMNEKGFFDSNENDKTSINKKQKTTKKIDPYDKANPMMFMASIDNLVLNIVNNRGREKLMKLSFSLKGPYEDMEMLIEKHRDAIVDATITITSASSSNELLSLGGKKFFGKRLKDEFNKIINENERNNPDIPKDVIKKLYFKTFVMR